GGLSIRPLRSAGPDASYRVQVLSDTGDVVGEGDDSTSVTPFAVDAGLIYVLKITGADDSTGHYNLALSPTIDDAGNDGESAAPLKLAADGHGTLSGQFDYLGDVDVFQFTAP